MNAREIRQSFLDYFASRGHHAVASSSLVPTDDPTLLFTNAGMNQFKDAFLGTDRRDYTRAATVQKCMRVSGKHNDLDNVGPSLRHHTFFEMLGNFSFGDYFKADAIPFAWELLTRVWGLDANRLFPSIFKGERDIPRDAEAYEAWAKLVPKERIQELGADDNFWSMGDTGPCGRCSEIYYFRGSDIPCGEPVCRGLECSCERYVEIWNNVFMEFDRQADGTLNPLPALSVDTGMGLERITSVIQGKLATYDTDLFAPILKAIAARAGRPYTASNEPGHPDVSMRVIADHLRAMTFLIADGVLPSNEWRGYVLRKIMRRAMRHGKKLGFTDTPLHLLVDSVIGEMGDAYPELVANREAIVRTVKAEEERFDIVLTSGLPKLEDLLDRVAAAGHTVVPGDEVFRLYDSLGVPLDFSQDLAEHRGLTIDQQAVDASMEAQRDRARSASSFDSKKAPTFTFASPADKTRLEGLADTFDGYATTSSESVVAAVFDNTRTQVASLPAGEEGFVVLDHTPFYAESGGQVSDTGRLDADDTTVAHVVGMSRLVAGGARVHRVEALAPLTPGQTVTAVVESVLRDSIRRNHTATHLLQAALRQTLGTHVRQAGSLVAPDRLRFDFAHFAAMTPDEKLAVERIVNEQVCRNTPVRTEVKNTEEAITGGATALFGEKYGDKVRVVDIEGFSTELCGGTHVNATGDIGSFVITEETGVAAGVRRIEALTGAGAVAHIQHTQATLARTLQALGVPADQAPDAIARLQAEAKRLARENEELKMKVALGGGASGGDDDVVTMGDAKFIARRVSGLEKGALRGLSDSLRDRLKRGVVVIAADNNGKVQLLVAVTKDLTDRVKAGQLVKELAPLIGGGGGGRPDFAEAGGKDASGIDALLSRARKMVEDGLANRQSEI
ncbi:MAG: alanine--tRNA ligase [Acidobacteria bacterium]|nr:alanine--tRNA ligase [Acidobacteriota bacterium]